MSQDRCIYVCIDPVIYILGWCGKQTNILLIPAQALKAKTNKQTTLGHKGRVTSSSLSYRGGWLRSWAVESGKSKVDHPELKVTLRNKTWDLGLRSCGGHPVFLWSRAEENLAGLSCFGLEIGKSLPLVWLPIWSWVKVSSPLPGEAPDWGTALPNWLRPLRVLPGKWNKKNSIVNYFVQPSVFLWK